MTRREQTNGRSARTPGEAARAELHARLPVTERRLELAGVSTALIEGGSGHPVVLLHGVGEFGAVWLRVIPQLVTTHRVIAPDLPGHGATEVPAGDVGVEGVLTWLDALIEETCDEPPVLVGHLLGGAIAARYAGRHSHRLSRLVLVDPLGLGPFRPTPAFALRMAWFLARPNERTMGRMLDKCVVDIDHVRGRLGRDWEPLTTYGLEGALTPSRKAAGNSLMKTFAARAIPDADLARITVPTTLIWGRHDRIARLRFGETASARYGWPLHVIEKCAADPHLEQPDTLVSLLRKATATQPEPEGGARR